MGNAVQLHKAIATGAGTYRPFKSGGVIQARLSAAGGTATVNLYGRMVESDVPYLMASFALSGVSDSANLAITDEPWAEIMANVIAIGGAGAEVTLTLGGA